MLLPIHVAAGGVAILLGTAALVAKKGGAIHRRSGLAFVFAMLAMGFSGSLLGLRKGPTDPNVFAGFMVAYFVGTAWATVQPASPWTKRLTAAALVIPSLLGLASILRGIQAFHSPRGGLDGVPWQMNFFLATVLLLAAFGDVRSLLAGALDGARRLRRHLWRMCFALFIAAGSFFSIRARVAKILPEPFTTAPMRALPIVLLFGAMFYWLWRVRSRRGLPVRS